MSGSSAKSKGEAYRNVTIFFCFQSKHGIPVFPKDEALRRPHSGASSSVAGSVPAHPPDPPQNSAGLLFFPLLLVLGIPVLSPEVVDWLVKVGELPMKGSTGSRVHRKPCEDAELPEFLSATWQDVEGSLVLSESASPARRKERIARRFGSLCRLCSGFGGKFRSFCGLGAEVSQTTGFPFSF